MCLLKMPTIVVTNAKSRKIVLGTHSNPWIFSAYYSRHVLRFLKKAMEFAQVVSLSVIKNVIKLMDVVKAEYYMESDHISQKQTHDITHYLINDGCHHVLLE